MEQSHELPAFISLSKLWQLGLEMQQTRLTEWQDEGNVPSNFMKSEQFVVILVQETTKELAGRGIRIVLD